MKPCTSSFTGLPETLTALPARQIQLRLNSYLKVSRFTAGHLVVCTAVRRRNQELQFHAAGLDAYSAEDADATERFVLRAFNGPGRKDRSST
jgi:hypothetical protein